MVSTAWSVVVLVAILLQLTWSSPVPDENHPLLRNKRQIRNGIRCMNNGKFYRNPDREKAKMWSTGECAKYYLCIENEVFEFKCSTGLLFDIVRQICDFKAKVDNCDVNTEAALPKPLLNTPEPICPVNELACADGTCLNSDLFCDGHADCVDGSDEGWCDAENDPNAAARCDYANCTLPNCFCSVDGTLIPGNLEANQVPQMITITFDDAVNGENWDLYLNKLFIPERKNPNGCPIHATFYISHEYNNYQHVQKLWNAGHEIAAHSITHRHPENWWSTNATIEDWFDEMVGQANIINRFAGVHMEDIRGIRVPFLRVGWNRQFLMMKEFGFVYDASMAAPLSDPPLWPYTLDYKMPHGCVGTGQRCPSRSFPGIWEMVLNQLEVEEYSCAMVDSCPSHGSEDEVYEMLMHNFKRHYNTNRAPFGLYFHTIWFKKRINLRAFQRFLEEMIRMQDVWIVNNWEAIQWMQRPTPINALSQFEPWKCKPTVPPEDKACNIARACKLQSRGLRGDRYLHTCTECPQVYPWIKNEFGLDI
uniref:Chitin-binding type-2 domain-containing protein n=1 Tax=Daphnia galeata TaxID=27404 RepID=A0A8J2RYS5_9CRUS|nr:unnamed protein product [Daphnia galeata]